eukprot:763230-Hanusia_phi.AAC.3
MNVERAHEETGEEPAGCRHAASAHCKAREGGDDKGGGQGSGSQQDQVRHRRTAEAGGEDKRRRRQHKQHEEGYWPRCVSSHYSLCFLAGSSEVKPMACLCCQLRWRSRWAILPSSSARSAREVGDNLASHFYTGEDPPSCPPRLLSHPLPDSSPRDAYRRQLQHLVASYRPQEREAPAPRQQLAEVGGDSFVKFFRPDAKKRTWRVRARASRRGLTEAQTYYHYHVPDFEAMLTLRAGAAASAGGSERGDADGGEGRRPCEESDGREGEGRGGCSAAGLLSEPLFIEMQQVFIRLHLIRSHPPLSSSPA